MDVMVMASAVFILPTIFTTIGEHFSIPAPFLLLIVSVSIVLLSVHADLTSQRAERSAGLHAEVLPERGARARGRAPERQPDRLRRVPRAAGATGSRPARHRRPVGRSGEARAVDARRRARGDRHDLRGGAARDGDWPGDRRTVRGLTTSDRRTGVGPRLAHVPRQSGTRPRGARARRLLGDRLRALRRVPRRVCRGGRARRPSRSLGPAASAKTPRSSPNSWSSAP